jgi:serine/threonine-protein kinase
VVQSFSYSDPQALAVDSHGVVYIAGDGANRVLAVSPDSSRVKIVATGLKHPVSMAVDARGTLYIADFGVGVIAVSSRGHRSLVGRHLDQTVALAVGPDGSLYAAGPPRGLTRIRPDGRQSVVSDALDLSSHLDGSLAIDSNGVAYFSGDGQLFRVTPHGAIPMFISLGCRWVAAGPGGTLYVADSRRVADPKGPSLVVRITKDGRRTRVGLGPNLPRGLAVDRQGAVYFIDGVSEHLLRVDDHGRTTTVGPLSGEPTALALDRQGNLYVGDYTDYNDGAGRVGARAVGTRILKVMSDGRQSVAFSGTVQYPRALAVDGAGTLYILDVLDHSGSRTRILKVAPGGGHVQVIPGFPYAEGLTVDRRGTLYVAVTDKYMQLSLIRVDGAGHRKTTQLHLDTLGPTPMAIDDLDVVYCAGDHQLAQIDPNGHQAISPSPLRGDIQALTVDKAGTLYLVGEAVRFSRDGDGRAVALPRGGRPITIAADLDTPEGIAVDAHGAIYIADTGHQRIVRVKLAA